MLGLFIIIPLVSLYTADYRGASPVTVGLALGIFGLTQSLLLLPFGFLSDIWGRRKLILIGLGLFALGSLVAALADTMPQLIIGRALQGTGAIAGVLLTLTSELFSEENRPIAMASIGGCIGIAFGISLILGPLVASYGGLSLVFWLCLLLAFISSVLVIWQLPPMLPSKERQAVLAGIKNARQLWQQIQKHILKSPIMMLNGTVFCLHCLQMALWLSIPDMLKNYYELPPQQQWKSYLLVIGAAFILVFPLLYWSRKYSRYSSYLLALAMVIMVPGQLLMWSGDSLVVFLSGMFLFFASFCYMEAQLPSLISLLYREHLRGLTMSCFSFFQFLGVFSGGLLGGLLVQWGGRHNLFLVLSLLALLWAIFLYGVTATKRIPADKGTL